MLERVVTVLVEPQDVDNVGATMRAMMNMGLARLRLVRPAPFDTARLPVIAHRSQSLVEAVETFDTLAAALADTVYTVGCTARRRSDPRPVLSPREAARLTLDRLADGPVAFLFGREDTGLANADLDACHALLTIPTDPAYPSLNLAQAVLVVAYELRLAATASDHGSERRVTGRATGAETEAMFGALADGLRAADFLVPSRATATIRALRALLLRAEPTREEAQLMTAIGRALRKTGRQES